MVFFISEGGAYRKGFFGNFCNIHLASDINISEPPKSSLEHGGKE